MADANLNQALMNAIWQGRVGVAWQRRVEAVWQGGMKKEAQDMSEAARRVRRLREGLEEEARRREALEEEARRREKRTAWHGRVEEVRELLVKGADPNAFAHWDLPYLDSIYLSQPPRGDITCWTRQKWQVGDVPPYIRGNVPSSPYIGIAITPLMMAAFTAQKDIVELLLNEKDIDPNITTREGWTALMFAACCTLWEWDVRYRDFPWQSEVAEIRRRNVLSWEEWKALRNEIINLLIEQGANKTVRAAGLTYLDLLNKVDNHRSYRPDIYLLDRILMHAVWHGKVEEVKALLVEGLPQRSGRWRVPYLLGVAGWWTRCFHSWGVDLTPLELAAFCGERDIVEILLKNGADPEGRALFFAACCTLWQWKLRPPFSGYVGPGFLWDRERREIKHRWPEIKCRWPLSDIPRRDTLSREEWRARRQEIINLLLAWGADGSLHASRAFYRDYPRQWPQRADGSFIHIDKRYMTSLELMEIVDRLNFECDNRSVAIFCMLLLLFPLGFFLFFMGLKFLLQ